MTRVFHMNFKNQDYLALNILRIQALFGFTFEDTDYTWMENEALLDIMMPRSLRDSFSSIISSQFGVR